MKGKAISHVQGKGSIAHNNRLFSPKNVDPNRTIDNVCYIHKPIAEAYSEIFDKAVSEYNSKQKRSDRMIKTGYYEHLFKHNPCNTVIEAANGQKSFYEDVVQVGTKDDTGVGSADAEIAKICLDEYMRGFQKRNPNFYVFNAVMHMDEATPHLHIDYIPVGHYNRGVPVQNGIAQALKEMGHGAGKDAINRWRQSERKVLKEICLAHGIDIADETPGRGYSMKCDEYKEHKDKIHAYEEQEKALEAEIQPLLEAKAIADDVSVSGTKTLFGNNYVVSGNEFSEMNKQKKALAVQQNDVKEMQYHFAKERLEMQFEREKLDEEREKLDKENTRLHDYEERLYRRDSKITHKENWLMERERACTELYNTQIELNKNYESVRNAYSELEKELSAANKYKKDSEALQGNVDRLEKSIESQRSEYEEQLRKKDDDISAALGELTECKEKVRQSEEEIGGLKKTISSLRSYIDKLFEIGAYMARNLRMDFEEIVNRRLDGYSLKHIFGDNGRER